MTAEAAAGQAVRRRRTVAGRLLASFLIVLAAFAVTLGWSLMTMREAARDATLVRDAYVPLLSLIGEALAGQNVMNTQLNHITSAKNPADVRQWIDTARRLRPVTLKRLRQRAEESLAPTTVGAGLRAQVVEETLAIERDLDAQGNDFDQLFQHLVKDEAARAEALRDRLIDTETKVAERLRGLRQQVSARMEQLTETAQRREQRSIQLLVGLSLLTLVVGLITSLYARRVLKPLSAVTERARAVAEGDLTPRAIVATKDEIGELAETFEGMVAAILRARSELVQAERLATIGKMAAHITHEVRNPLSSIGLNLELLEEELLEAGTAGESRQLLAAIQSEVERLAGISEQYLAAVREPRLQLELEPIGDVISECYAFLRPELEKAEVSSELQMDEALPQLAVDEAQLKQALLNLIRNAREAVGPGGTLVLRVERRGEEVAICVDDDGPGIPDDVRASIFDPFYTTKRHGTGLGLAVTHSIVEAHGGTIVCAASPEGGTRFCISLPLPAESTASAEQP